MAIDYARWTICCHDEDGTPDFEANAAGDRFADSKYVSRGLPVRLKLEGWLVHEVTSSQPQR